MPRTMGPRQRCWVTALSGDCAGYLAGYLTSSLASCFFSERRAAR